MIVQEILTAQFDPRKELDAILVELCEMIIHGQMQDSEFTPGNLIALTTKECSAFPESETVLKKVTAGSTDTKYLILFKLLPPHIVTGKQIGRAHV